MVSPSLSSFSHGKPRCFAEWPVRRGSYVFLSYEDLQAAIREYEDDNYAQLWVNSSRTIAAAKKKGLTRYVEPALKFAEIECVCTNGGWKFTSRSTGERPNQK